MRFYMVVLMLTVLGCVVKNYKVTRTSATASTAKPATCDFTIATTKVERPYEEIAILDRQDYLARDAGEFKELIKKDVCELGGDVVFAEVNGYGQYTRGTVLRWTEAKDATH